MSKIVEIQTDAHVGTRATWVPCEFQGRPALRSAGYSTARAGRLHGPMVIAAGPVEVRRGSAYEPTTWRVEVLEGTYY